MNQLSKREQHLLNLFRALESRHTQDSVLFLMQEVAWGRSTKKADKVPLRSLIAYERH